MNNFEFLPADIIITVDVLQESIMAFDEYKTVNMTKSEFISFIEKNDATIAGNGVVYHNRSTGIVPTILNTWFDDRNNFKQQMREYSPGTDEYIYFDRKQLITKIMLNSLYGVLLLPTFRFYDKQNGEAVTLSSQDIIKFSNITVNKYYQNKIPSFTVDAVQYSDTDSNYIQSLPLINDANEKDEVVIYNQVVEISKNTCEYVNNSLKWLTARHFNSKNCRLLFQEEKISKRAFWGQAKKRYAQLSVELLPDGTLKEKVDVKGFDLVRSSFPKIFRAKMKQLVEDVLHDIPVSELNQKVRTFKKEYKNSPIFDIMLPSSVKEISKYKDAIKGTPIHVKSAQNYNKLLSLHKIESIPPIDDGDKIVYAYMQQNPFGFETMALKGQGEDPEPLVEFVERFIDRERVFQSTFISKLDTIWHDLGWGKVEQQEPNNFF